ncbi:hypothetical protein HS99_0010120 [Kitasatospora aureofaciens]|uniref:Uncharacterized protein n=1 Tax=Kitasatospora aureofaciens TaxID=1894 RepID=A0A1E7N296_KITAU|nr:hypothetical protein B6264_25625 [Kitasatospora aureofaciens]OEV34818.1 hypothetical protein HS99_0010120 [Kitasatospora aureofaciens]GGU92698.1 hypothetical protein GCM10010502_52770 [Kitasatospora aureofaciens]
MLRTGSAPDVTCVTVSRAEDCDGWPPRPPWRRRSARPLQFSTRRDPAVIAAFVRTRVLEPEREDFRRGPDELPAHRGVAVT